METLGFPIHKLYATTAVGAFTRDRQAARQIEFIVYRQPVKGDGIPECVIQDAG